jgi:hypothetical protein
MIFLCSFHIKGEKTDALKIKHRLQDKPCFISESLEHKYKDPVAEFYQVCFEKPSPSDIAAVCDFIRKDISIEQIEVEFYSLKDCFEPLLEKGFVRYEEADYIEIKNKNSTVKVILMQNDFYRLIVQKKYGETVDARYMFNLIKRVFDIIEWGGKYERQ